MQRDESNSTITTRRRSSLFRSSAAYDVVLEDNCRKNSAENLYDDNVNDESSEAKDESGCGYSSCVGGYRELWIRHPYFRYYFFSHVCMNMGDWFVRIASLLLVTELADKEGTGLAYLILANILPKAFLTHVGGILADSCDRRHIMIALDLVAGVITLGFVLAIHYKSLPILYAVTAFRAATTAMYYPVTTSLICMLVPEKQDLLLANTMKSWAWSTMAMFGGFLAGSLAAVIGLDSCYLIDSLTFFISAALLTQIPGRYTVAQEQQANVADETGFVPISAIALEDNIYPQQQSKVSSVVKGFSDFGLYLWTCGFGIFTLLKATAAFVWGAEDIISTAFAEAGTTTESAKSIRMGLTFTFIGIGAFLGPTAANLFIDTNQPKTLSVVCWVGFFLQLLSWLGMSQAHKFDVFLLFTLIRATGSSIIWVNSTLLLQTMSAPQQLGKVLAVEFFTYTIAESVAASSAGRMEDAGVSKNQIAGISAGIAICATLVWGVLLRKDFPSSSLCPWQPVETAEQEIVSTKQGGVN